MSKYSVSAEVLHTWTFTENYETEIDAESEEAAILCLHKELSKAGGDIDYANYDEHDVYNIEVSLIEEPPMRCEKTIDLFKECIE